MRSDRGTPPAAPARAAWGALTALIAVVALAPAADLSIRFTGVTAEPAEFEHRGPLTAADSKPLRGAFAVLLLTPDGTIPAEDLAKARSAADTVAKLLMTAAQTKYGADVPITHEIVVASGPSAAPHRERLRDAGFTYISMMPVTGTTQRIAVEGYGLKEFAPADVLGEGVAVIAVSARPAITADGSVRLNLTGRVTATKVGARGDGVDEAVFAEALQRFRTETVRQLGSLFMPYNFRTWDVTESDRERVVLGARPLRKAVPMTLSGQAVRLRLTITAELQFASAADTDRDWTLEL